MENANVTPTFGIVHLWSQGDGVIRTIAILLLLMSVLSWVIILVKALDLRRHRSQARRVESFWHATDFAEGLDRLGREPDNPFRLLATHGRDAASHLRRQDGSAPTPQLHDQLDISDWIQRALRHASDDFLARLQSGLWVLASVGSTAPFVGLFGTVWGIYHALIGIGLSGNAALDQVAGPIGEALIMTALGLAVAIPAVLGYNALVRGHKSLMHQVNRFAHELHAYFVTGTRVAAASPAPAASAAVRPLPVANARS
ncbi:MAG: MotA/TolQ/ExbB proton channel family protein [Tepidimonas sp.]|uniref:MotA/TolQ/ExbB proton channel family protein n=1 Tax=Tepidimonas sp. TaxID=2002775 RepID=UPI00298F0F37|nr:MotA/TolQ/ExbB proton channel family protein [Tepidimonas sp.]MDW8335958.1 MotA/TolQ/ExbB proton channel family protein [Tepidimonas sp.]